MSGNKIRIDWATVRGLGELTILTRASYTLLLLIPILALAWPVLSGVSNRIDASLSKVTASSEEVIRVIQNAEENVSNLRVKTEVDVLERIVNPTSEMLKKLEKATRDTQETAIVAQNKIRSLDWRLPKALVQSFLAAAAIFIGQLLYQAFANQVVKENTIDQYESSKKLEYKQYSTATSLDHALTELSRTEVVGNESMAMKSLIGKGDQVRKKMIQSWTQEELIIAYAGMNRTERAEVVDLLNNEPSKALGLVGQASRKHYTTQANAWGVIAFLSLAFYSIGIYLILIAFIRQLREVVSAAKLTSIVDVFSI